MHQDIKKLHGRKSGRIAAEESSGPCRSMQVHAGQCFWPPSAVRDSFAAPVDVLDELISVMHVCLQINLIGNCTGGHG